MRPKILYQSLTNVFILALTTSIQSVLGFSPEEFPKPVLGVANGEPYQVRKLAQALSKGAQKPLLWQIYWDEAKDFFDRKEYSKCIELLKQAQTEQYKYPDSKLDKLEAQIMLEKCYLATGQIDKYIQAVKVREVGMSWKTLFQDALEAERAGKNSISEKIYLAGLEVLVDCKSIDERQKAELFSALLNTARDANLTALAERVQPLLQANDDILYYIDDALVQRSQRSSIKEQIVCIDKNYFQGRYLQAASICQALLKQKELRSNGDELERDAYYRVLDRFVRASIASNQLKDLEKRLKTEIDVLTTGNQLEKADSSDKVYLATMIGDLGLIENKNGKRATAEALIKKAVDIINSELQDKYHPKFLLLAIDLKDLQINDERYSKDLSNLPKFLKKSPRIGALASERLCLKYNELRDLSTETTAQSDWIDDQHSSYQIVTPTHQMQYPGLDGAASAIMQSSPVLKLSLKESPINAKDYRNWILNTHMSEFNYVKPEHILEIKGKSDNAGSILRNFGLPSQKISPSNLSDTNLDSTRIIVVNCPGNLSNESIMRLRRFVANGGYLISTDGALSGLIEKAFPGYVSYSGDFNQACVVDAVAVDQSSRLFKNIPNVAFWNMTQRNQMVRVNRPGPVRVLVRSRLLSRADPSEFGILAFSIDYMKGRVLHIVGHLSNDNHSQTKIPDPAPDIKISMRHALTANFLVEAIKNGRSR